MTRPATFKKGFGGDIATSGILNDLDGSLGSGAPGGVVAPYAGHFANNPDCVVGYDVFDKDLGTPEYVRCTSTIRRVSFSAKWTSAKTNSKVVQVPPHSDRRRHGLETVHELPELLGRFTVLARPERRPELRRSRRPKESTCFYSRRGANTH